MVYDVKESELPEHKRVILDMFNSADAALKYQIEEPSESSGLAFLDAELSVANDGFIMYKWYMKPVHSGNYMPYRGYNTTSCKRSFVINRFACLAQRCNTWNGLNESMEKMLALMQRNGYPFDFVVELARVGIDRIMRDKPPNQTGKQIERDVKEKLVLKLPYVSDNCNRAVRNTLNKLGVDGVLINRKTKRMRSLVRYPLTGVRNKCGCQLCQMLPPGVDCLTNKVVYKMTCQKCEPWGIYEYIGKANASIKARMSKHASDIRCGRSSALLDHIREKHPEVTNFNGGFLYRWFRVEILERNKNFVENHMQKAINIREVETSAK